MPTALGPTLYALERGSSQAVDGRRGSCARWPDLTQTLQPAVPAVACSVAPAGSLSHESRVNSSLPSVKLPSRTSNSIPPGRGTEMFMPGAQRSMKTSSQALSYNRANSTPREAGRGRERKAGAVDAHWRPVIGVELPQLDKDRATGLRAGCVATGRWVADISARGVVAVLILKYAVQHQELLAATVGVGREAAVRGVADDRGRARHLIADAVEHSSVDTGNGRRRPVQAGRVNCRASAKVRVQI